MEAGLVSTSIFKQFATVELQQYSLVVYPDANVISKITKEKQDFLQRYGKKEAVNASTFLTIANFTARETMEETIIRYMQRICKQHAGFSVALNNYGALPPDSIYLRIQDVSPFRQILKELYVINDYVTSCSCPPIKIVSNPHITIAQQLGEDIYLKTLLEYGQKSFYETFVVDKLLLLKKANDLEQEKCVNVFSLQPKSIASVN